MAYHKWAIYLVHSCTHANIWNSSFGMSRKLITFSWSLASIWKFNDNKICVLKDFTCGTVVKNQPAMQETRETRVGSLGWEALLEEEMATHSSILAWIISWTEEPGGLQFMGLQIIGHNWVHTHTQCKILDQKHEYTLLWNDKKIFCFNSVIYCECMFIVALML